MKAVTDLMRQEVEKEIAIIKKGTLELHNEDELRHKLLRSKESDKALVIKLGLDPTAPDIHLGHTVVLRKIRQLQKMGHKAFLIIGDFTGRIGDPTGKEKGRPQLTEAEVLANADTYREQFVKVLDSEKTILCFNSEWLDELKPSDLVEMMSRHTVARILERDSFKKRMKSGQPIGLHELIYPLLQGLDSLNIEADIEIGGMDQKFNILTGREMQHKLGKEKQIAIFMPILEGLDGKQKMSKSLNNYIGINEPAEMMFNKIMTIGDELIIKYFELLTDRPPSEIKKIEDSLRDQKVNPRDIKLSLAHEIVTLYQSVELADAAKENFIKVMTKGELPEDIPSFQWQKDDSILSFLSRHGLLSSRSEVRRMVQQKGIKINDITILEPELTCVENGDVIRIGKKKFAKVEIMCR